MPMQGWPGLVTVQTSRSSHTRVLQGRPFQREKLRPGVSPVGPRGTRDQRAPTPEPLKVQDALSHHLAGSSMDIQVRLTWKTPYFFFSNTNYPQSQQQNFKQQPCHKSKMKSADPWCVEIRFAFVESGPFLGCWQGRGNWGMLVSFPGRVEPSAVPTALSFSIAGQRYGAGALWLLPGSGGPQLCGI